MASAGFGHSPVDGSCRTVLLNGIVPKFLWWLRVLYWSPDHCSAGHRFRLLRQAGGMYLVDCGRGLFSQVLSLLVIYLPNLYENRFVLAKISLLGLLLLKAEFIFFFKISPVPPCTNLVLSSHLALQFHFLVT